jgi:hypothetical protein
MVQGTGIGRNNHASLPIPKEMTEAEIKREICEWLETKQWECMFWVQSAGKIPGRINRSRYQRNGIPDILGIWKMRPLAIEVKKPGGKISEEQRKFMLEFMEYGGIGIVAWSLDDVKKELT